MKPKNVARWLRINIKRVILHLSLEDVKYLEWELRQRKEQMQKEGLK